MERLCLVYPQLMDIWAASTFFGSVINNASMNTRVQVFVWAGSDFSWAESHKHRLPTCFPKGLFHFTFSSAAMDAEIALYSDSVWNLGAI